LPPADEAASPDTEPEDEAGLRTLRTLVPSSRIYTSLLPSPATDMLPLFFLEESPLARRSARLALEGDELDRAGACRLTRRTFLPSARVYTSPSSVADLLGTLDDMVWLLLLWRC